jgi:HEAT repeat protein
MVISLAVMLFEPVAIGADKLIPLNLWQEESVLAALQDPSANVRYAAVTWLSDRRTSSEPITKALAQFLKPDIPSQIKKGAVQALGNTGSAASAFAPRLAELLGESDRAVRRASALALSSMGAAASAVAPQVAALLKDPSPEVRFYALEVLGSIGPAAAPLAAQIASLVDNRAERVDVRAAAAQALSGMGPAAVAFLPHLAGLLNAPDADVRVEMVEALGAMVGLGPPVTALAPQVAALLRDPDSNVRRAAAETLGRMGSAADAFAPQIANLLADSDPNVRRAAAQALGKLGAAASPFASRIVSLLRDSDPAVRSAAATVLGTIGPTTPVVPAQLAAQLRDPDGKVRDLALLVLAQMGAAVGIYAPQVVALLRDREPDVRTAAVLALRQMGSAAAAAAPQLIPLLSDADVNVSMAAQQVLSAPAAAAVAPQIAALLQEPRHRYAAIQVLGGMGVGAANYAPQIAALMKDSGGFLEIQALGSMGPAAVAVAPQVAALLTDSDSSSRSRAIEALGLMQAAAFVPQIAARLQDPQADVRFAAAEALARMGSAALKAAPLLAAAMSDADSKVRGKILEALDGLAGSEPLQDRSVILHCLSAAQVLRTEAGAFLLRAYLYRKIDGQDLILIRWMGSRGARERPAVTSLAREDALAALRTFNDSWDETKQLPGLRKDIADRIAEVASAQAWELTDVPLLEGLQNRMEPEYHAQALTVQAVLDRNEWYKKLQEASGLIAAHIAAWVALIFAYPRRRWVQSFFFWNKWARRFLGAGYVGLLITYVPWLRRRMLQPFHASLLPQGLRDHFKEQAYFAGSDVLLEMNRHTEPGRLPLKEVLPAIRGQVVLKGQSGLGKTLLLLRLALAEKEPVVFLRATECADGVGAAIQKKLHGQLRDAGYLRALIHAGALKVLIDGLNEAPPDTRARITQFVEEYFNGDFVLTTQPMSLELPATARVYVLQPLLPEQIEPFLLQQWDLVRERATLDLERYQAAVARYVQSIRGDSQGSMDPRLVALSSPMDATLAAELLARGETPDMFRLVEQRYRVMAESFREEEGREFQLQRFSERVYEWRKSGAPDVNTKDFEAEVAALVKDRLMIERTEVVKHEKGEKEINRWFFRHDKIMEFFLLPAFMGANSARRQEHDQDERFWGVYELLAVRLPDDEEFKLYQFLIEKAADTNKNDLQNRYTLARRFRRPVHQSEGNSRAQIA